jgi:hypothetical protein
MKFRLLFALALAPLAGCIAIPAYVPLDPAVQGSLKDMRVTSAIPQDEVYLSAASPGVVAAAGGGLIAALIESNIAKGRQEEIQGIIEPFYAAVDDVDFRAMFWAALLPELQKLHGGRIAELKTTAAALSFRERFQHLPGSLPPGRSFMYLGTQYQFSPDFSRLSVSTTIDLWRGGDKEPLYSNIFNYQSAPVAAAGAGAIKLWSADGGRLYRSLLAEGAGETAKMLRLDAAHPRFKGADQGLPGGARSLEARKASPGLPAVSGPVLDEQPTRVVVRNTDGRLYSLPR